MRRLQLAISLVFVLLLADEARALCGDVTDDGKRTASDALAVLRVAVGQPDTLVCAGEGPSRLRYYNDFQCGGEVATSTASFNDFTFQADSGATSDYQSVDLTEISAIDIDLCGGLFAFDGPIHLPPDRSITFWMLLLDPAVYQFPGIEVPAQLVLADDGTDASAFSTSASMTPSAASSVLYGGVRR